MNDSYDKISSLIMYLGVNLVLKLNVNLNRVSPQGDIFNYHSEYEYQSGSQKRTVTSVKLSFSYYLSIENSYEEVVNSKKGFLKFSYPEFPQIIDMLNHGLIWFTDEFKDLFIYDKTGLYLNSCYYDMKDLKYETSIGMTQCSINPRVYQINSQYYKGLDFFFENYHGILSIDGLIGLNQYLQHCDLYTAAQGLVNYLASPMVGVNKVVINKVIPTIVREPGVNQIALGTTRRMIGKHNELDEI